MKKPSSKIREEISRLQEQLKHAETHEAERIGRIALKAGLGESTLDEVDLQTAFVELAREFREGKPASSGGKKAHGDRTGTASPAAVAYGATAGEIGEA